MSDTAESKPDRPTWHRWKSRQRQQSHDRAHEEGADERVPDFPEHPLIPAAEPELIADDAALNSLLIHLREAGTFGYDSEFIGEHSYHPRLCLIQTATAERIALIDPLAKLDLTPLWELLTDSDLEKVVHAGRQDLEPAVRAVGAAPENVFDTQLAAAFADLHYPASLGRLIEEATGINIGRGLKFSQWDARPLSALQMRYAADDVRFLPLIRSFIVDRLNQFGNFDWAIEECRTLSDPESYGFDVRAMRGRVRGAGGLDGRGRSLLDALLHWRDEHAREHDMPPRTFLKDAVLLDLARSPVTTRAELERVRGLPRPVKQHCGDGLLDVFRRTLAELDVEEGKSDEQPLPPANREVVNRLWGQVVEIAEPRSINPAIVTSKRELGRMLSRHGAGRTLLHTSLRRGWRKELLGSLFDQYL